MPKEKRFAIISPAADEEETIERFTIELLGEIKMLKISGSIFFVVDKASTAETIAILNELAKKNASVKVINEPKNRHVVDAYIRGFHEALDRHYDYIIDMDCGFSHLPSELSKIVKGLEEGYDCVFGIRPLTSLRYSVPIRRRMYSLGGTIISNALLGMHYKDTTSGFNGYKKEILKKILNKSIQSSGNFWHTEMRYHAKQYRYKEVMITYTSPSNRVKMKTINDSFTQLLRLTKERFHLRKTSERF